MKNIVFLDLDGVLNICSGPNSTFYHSSEHFDLELINNINIAFDNIDSLSIVMSSSWRFDYDDALEVLKQCGFNHIDKFIGKTEFFEDKVNFRGNEIKDWIINNNFEGNYICIDDNIQEICGELCNAISSNKCFETKSSKGFLFSDIKLLIYHFH